MTSFESLRDNPSAESKIELDPCQKIVVDLKTGYNLVLAPPGCGKTHILAERVVSAIKYGVDVKDMLCLTFTNRAARGMKTRIDDALNDKSISGNLFVGNLHRYCSSFLYEHKVVSQTSAILDETDTTNIILCLLDRNETDEELDYDDKNNIEELYVLQHYVYQIRNYHSEDILLDTKGISKKIIQRFCNGLGNPYTIDSFIQLYDNLDSLEVPITIRGLYNKLLISKAYEKYKEDKGLNDFDDLLLKAYDFMSANPTLYKHYKWIQIDEVQDLNRLQLAIVDCLFTNPKEGIILYLGDEQQAIFSFIGAKLSTLDYLKKRCSYNLFHLQSNHRSPKYLLDVFNNYAERELNVDKDLLPNPTLYIKQEPLDLRIETVFWEFEEYKKAVELVLSYPKQDKTAIIVPFNKDADEISKLLDDEKISHFKISGKDLFSEPTIQTLFAHFNVIGFETNLMAWSRIMKNLHVYPKYSLAREFVSNLQSLMLCPTDFLYYDNSSYVEQFCNAYRKEIVIFDTETTGLNVFEDDIVQIAAIRVRNGVQIGDTFNVLLHTNKKIPEYLGDIENPLVEEYRKRTDHLDRAYGLLKFLEFVGDTPLLGHNVEYDYRILDYNLRRDCHVVNLEEKCPVYYDSLKLCHIVDPKLKSYKLKDLLNILELQGENSHLADDDVMATKSIVDYCMEKSFGIIHKQKDFMRANEEHISKFVSIYRPLYFHTKNKMYSRESSSKHCALVEELQYLYNTLTSNGIINPLDKISYVIDYLDIDVIRKDITPTLKEQLDKHIIELNTFKEADLCDEKATSMQEHIFVSTVHKAKGLEFKNVIVCSVVDEVYPYWDNKNHFNKIELDREDARKLYVAMSRSQKRLCLITFSKKQVWSRKWKKYYVFDVFQSPFLISIRHFFNKSTEELEKEQIRELENYKYQIVDSEVSVNDVSSSMRPRLTQTLASQVLHKIKGNKFQGEDIIVLTEKIKEGDAKSMYIIGRMYENGIQVEKSMQNAFHYYVQSANLGNKDALWHVGECYCEGKGVEKNSKKAFEIFSALYHEGHVEGKLCYSCCLEKGIGCAKNILGAYNIWKSFENSDISRALLFMARNYENGTATNKNFRIALKFSEKAAILGDARAVSWSGRLYIKLGDFNSALFWLRIGEQLEDKFSLYYLGLLYEFGEGVVQNRAKAIAYYKRSMELGDSDAKKKFNMLNKID